MKNSNVRHRRKRKYTKKSAFWTTGKTVKVKRSKPKRTMNDLLKTKDYSSIVADLSSFLNSSTWNIIKALLIEEIFTHEAKMRTFLRKGDLHIEGTYELGATEALEYVLEKMIQDFIEVLKTNKPVGLVEDFKPEEDEIASTNGVHSPA